MPDTKPDETILVKRAVDGDVDAFGDLYTLHLNAIYRYIYYRIGDVQEAEDLTEQVFLKAWEALPGYQQKGKPFTSWLYRIAHNIVIDHHRQRKKHTLSVERLQTNELDKDQKSALQTVIESEEAMVLATALSQLTDEQQQVIVLRFVERFSHKEIAQVIDKNEGACRMIQYRALTKLQKIIYVLEE
jgi:RNA polymerase sigma-70 factor (ECF subfamily)